MAQLNTFVLVRDPDGHDVWFGPDKDLPDWATEKITNPAAYAIAPKRKAPEPAPAVVTEPENTAVTVGSRDEALDHAEAIKPVRRTRKAAGA
ncbi:MULTISPECIES: hypothetical protein [Nocardia]|uniref:hypothetical protein n=1 Tax=Nocardia TaxID=1817 RepID=UPI000D696470|nr:MULTISPECIES: hypothetical protein [Nocardia]